MKLAKDPEMSSRRDSNFLILDLFSVNENAQNYYMYCTDSKPMLVGKRAAVNYAYHSGAGSSAKAFMHFLQIFNSGEFAMYDYGSPELNKKYYGGREKPPKYPLDQIKDFKRITLICGKYDRISTPPDYHRLKEQLASQNSLFDFKEVEQGHIGLMCPAQGHGAHLDYMINHLLSHSTPENDE